MAVAKHVITVTSNTWDEDDTVRELVGALHVALDTTKGKASRLGLTETKDRWGGKKLVAKVTVERAAAQIA